MYAPLAKAVLEPVSGGDVAECTARAVRLSVAGRPGPVVVVLPEDVTEAGAGTPRSRCRPRASVPCPAPEGVREQPVSSPARATLW